MMPLETIPLVPDPIAIPLHRPIAAVVRVLVLILAVVDLVVVRLAPMLNHTRRRVVLSGIVRLVAARAVLLPRAAKHRAGVREVHAEALERVEEGVEVGVGGCVDFGGEEALEGGAVFVAKEVLEDVARCRGRPIGLFDISTPSN